MIDSSPQAFRAEEMNTVKVRYVYSPKEERKFISYNQKHFAVFNYFLFLPLRNLP